MASLPLIENWADESWPLNSRQASEIITEQVLQQQRSSIIFDSEEDNGNDALVGASDDQGNSNSTIDDPSLLQEVMTHVQVSQSEEVQSEVLSNHLSLDSSTPTHMAQSFMYNPYNVNDAKVVLHRCTCEVCGPMLYQKHHQEHLVESLHEAGGSPKVVASQTTSQHPQEQEADEEGEWDLPTYKPAATPNQKQHITNATPVVAAAPPQFHHVPTGPATAAARTLATAGSFKNQRRAAATLGQPQPSKVSQFMPPPPPHRITTAVYEEEGFIKNPCGIYYQMVMRWYAKVQESQQYFLTRDNHCPCPTKGKQRSFEAWADEISGWWHTHFEYMQRPGRR